MAKIYEVVTLNSIERDTLLLKVETDLDNEIPDTELLKYILDRINLSDDLKKKIFYPL